MQDFFCYIEHPESAFMPETNPGDRDDWISFEFPRLRECRFPAKLPA